MSWFKLKDIVMYQLSLIVETYLLYNITILKCVFILNENWLMDWSEKYQMEKKKNFSKINIKK